MVHWYWLPIVGIGALMVGSLLGCIVSLGLLAALGADKRSELDLTGKRGINGKR